MNLMHCEAFDQVIIKIAETYNIDLFGNFDDTENTHVRLRQNCFDDLSFERIWDNQVSISHVSVMNGDLMRDPEIVLFYDSSDHGSAKFQPISFTNNYAGAYSKFAKLDDRSNSIVSYDEAQTQDTIEFLKTWAENIVNQGWLDRSAVEVVK